MYSTKKWIRKGLIVTTVVVASLVAGLLMIEVAGRATGLLNLRRSGTRFSETKGYELDPKHEGINSHGLRDVEFPLSKPPNTYRIAALGDSFTYGGGITSGETYVKQLESMLNDRLGEHGVRYEVLNAGVPGFNTQQELIHLQEVGLQFSPT